jgi:hypothetical protein
VSCKSAAIAVGNGPAEAVARNTGSGSNLDGTFVGVSAAGLITNYKSDVPTPLKSAGGYAYQFDGVDDYVNLTTGLAALVFAAPASLSFWYRGTSDTAQKIFSVMDSDTASARYFTVTIGGNPTGTLTDELITVSGTSGGNGLVGYCTATRTELFDGNWHHIVVTANGSAWAIYLDGVSKTVTIGSGALNLGTWTNVTTPDFAAIGVQKYNSVLNSYVNGQLDDVRINNVALSPAQIAQLYAGQEATGATPVSHWGFDEGPFGMPADGDAIWGWESRDTSRLQFVQGTAANRPVFVQQTAALNNKPSLYFDGVNDLLRCATAIGSSDTEGTVVMVIVTSTDVLTEQAIFASSDEASATKFFRLGIYNGGWRYNQNDAGTADTLDAGTVDASTAYLVVWQSDGSTINGEYNNYSMLLSETSGANNGDWLGDTSARDSTSIGGSNANATPAKWFKGWIADMAVYSRKLTASELNKLKKYARSRYGVSV